ncbi:hypothetical protein ED733_003457 [Metarhizium rileyi]|uniref:Uncharacterized protein n=1 Tax=Metarhizium rileyi (strain RCEF 4871) TaxID=1649241 RepID=A0A5C6G3W9_METRR|nr:hypothetical protein ED733_003457 [Metarhizium rileyi]
MSVDSLELACMADLGRQRQDELPLSNRERKGPSFAPSGRNGTAHIPSALKKVLETKWNVQINDEESEQMEGLAPDYRAPPNIRQESKGHKRIKRHDSQNVPTADLGGLVPPGGSARHFSASKSTGTLPHKQQVRSISDNGPVTAIYATNCGLQTLGSNQDSLPVSSTSKPAAPVEQSSNTNDSISIRLPIRLSKSQDHEHVVLRGICKLLNPKDRLVLFVVSYTMRLRKDTDEGYLVLSTAGKEDRVHNVLELMSPDTRDDCCRVCSKNERNGFAYILQFPNILDTQKFKIFLESLQQAAAREANLEDNQTKPRTKSIQATQTPSGLLGPTNPVIKWPSLSATSATSEVTRLTASTLPSTVPTPSKQATVEGLCSDAKLIDFDDSPCCSPAARELIIEDAAEKLVELINKILPEASAAGLLLSDDTIADIEETAIDDWLARGFLQSETDDMKADLLDLLRILVRLKRKAESRRQTQPVIRSLQGYDEVPRPCRITYTASELERLNTAQPQEPTKVERIQYTSSEIESIGKTTMPSSVGGLDTSR